MVSSFLKQTGKVFSLSALSAFAFANTDQTINNKNDHSISWSTTAGISLKSINFSESISPALGSATGRGNISTSVPSLELSTLAEYGEYFAAISWEGSPADIAADSSIPYATGTAYVDRKDINVVVGYRALEKLNIFGGYLMGETAVEPIAGTGGSYPGSTENVTLNNNIAGKANPNYKQVYSEAGAFIGASYGFEIGSSSFLEIRSAYASLTSRYEDNPSSGAFSFEGDADGFSFSMHWRGALTNRIKYSFNLKRQNYSTNNAKDSNFDNNKVKFQEAITVVGVSLMANL